MKLYTFILIFIFLIPRSILSQHIMEDSLYYTIRNMKDDSSKVKSLLKYGDKLRSKSPEIGINVGFKALALAEKINNDKLILKSYYSISAGYYSIGLMDKCLEYAKKAEIVSMKLNSFRLGDIYNILVIAYTKMADMKNALHYSFKGIEIFENNNDKEGVAYLYNSIGSLYWERADLLNAKKYYLIAKDVFAELKDSFQLSNSYLNLFLVSDEKDKIKYLKKAEVIGKKINDYNLNVYLYNNLGAYYFKDSIDEGLAKKYYKKALYFANEIGDINMIGQITDNIGGLYLHENKLDSSLIFIRKSIFASKKSKNIDELYDGYYYMYENYKKQNNHDSALFYLEKAWSFKDSLYSLNMIMEIEDANAKYESEKKDAELTKKELEIVKHKSNNNKILGIASMLILISFVMFFLYSERQKRRKRESELILYQEQLEKQKLKELDVLKNEFFANITHELRTPLTLILGPLNNMFELTKDVKLIKNLKLAKNNAKRLLEMVNQILDLSKLENEKIEINYTEVKVNQFIKRILFSFQSSAEINNVNLDYNSEIEDDINFLIDIEKVETILINLISNALKFSNKGGNITIKSFSLDESIKIMVVDNGNGIPKDEIEKIFDRFYQSKETDKNINSGGTGIGLALTKSLVSLLDGSIMVKSEIGEGSEFTIVIPTSFSFASKEILSKNKKEDIESFYEPILFNGEKPKILIIEDNVEMQEYIKDFLKEEYRVEIANNGFEGIELLQKKPFDLISCDVMMPKMDGFKLKEKINELKIQSDIPFIFLTAKVLEDDKLTGLMLGVDDYITKPFNKYEYKARIYNLIKNRKSRLESDIELGGNSNKILESNEIKILKKAEKLVAANITNPNLKVSDLALELNYSQRNLSRLIKKLTGMTSVQFILELRLQRAYKLLKSKSKSTVSEVQFEVGIESRSHFFKKFKDRFGVSPGELEI